MSNAEKFKEIYARKLTEAIARNPEQYGYGPDNVPVVVERMMVAIEKGSFEIGNGIRNTCKELNIAVKRKDIMNYVKG